jgi:hypothetical protein
MQQSHRSHGGFNPLLQKPFEKDAPKPKFQPALPIQPSPPTGGIPSNQQQFQSNVGISSNKVVFNQNPNLYSPGQPMPFNGQTTAQFQGNFQQNQKPPQVLNVNLFGTPQTTPRQPQSQQLQQHNHHHQANPLRGFGERRGTHELSMHNVELHDRSMTFHPRPPSPQLRFGNNMFENYTMLLAEIKKKNDRIAEVKANIAKVKISSNDQEVRHFKTLVDSKQRELNQLLQIHNSFENEKQTLTQKLAELDSQLQQKLAKQSKTQQFGKSSNQLNNELASLTREYDTLRTQLHKMDYEAKIEYENQYRDLMESKMFAIVMEAAKGNQNPDIQNLYKRLEIAHRNRNPAT